MIQGLLLETAGYTSEIQVGVLKRPVEPGSVANPGSVRGKDVLEKHVGEPDVATEPAADLQNADIDRPLVERSRQGDLAAFRELVDRYQSRAQSIAIGVIGSREDAEDIVQEAFLKAFRNLNSFRGQSSFYTWFYRIVFNLAIDLSRKRYRRSESSMGDHSAIDALSLSSPADASDFMGSIPNPDQVMQRTDLGKEIRKAIGGLSPEHRAVILLREVEGLSYSEISDVVGCSKGTVMSRLHHARKRLQKSLADFMPKLGNRRAGASSSSEVSGEDMSEEDFEEEITAEGDTSRR